MRLYTFVNMYLSPIQHGIQTAHVVSDLYEKYRNIDVKKCGSLSRDALFEWGKNHKTIIVLNGGYASNLQNIYDSICNQDIYPYAMFNEEVDALNGAITAVGIVLPETVYNIGKRRESDMPLYNPNQLDNDIYDMMSKYKLA